LLVQKLLADTLPHPHLVNAPYPMTSISEDFWEYTAPQPSSLSDPPHPSLWGPRGGAVGAGGGVLEGVGVAHRRCRVVPGPGPRGECGGGQHPTTGGGPLHTPTGGIVYTYEESWYPHMRCPRFLFPGNNLLSLCIFFTRYNENMVQ